MIPYCFENQQLPSSHHFQFSLHWWVMIFYNFPNWLVWASLLWFLKIFMTLVLSSSFYSFEKDFTFVHYHCLDMWHLHMYTKCFHYFLFLKEIQSCIYHFLEFLVPLVHWASRWVEAMGVGIGNSSYLECCS